MSRQKPAASICCQVLPVWRTVKDKSNENSIASPVQRCCTQGCRGGVLTTVGSLLEEEAQGRYGCRPNSICTSLRFVEMRSGRQENLFCCVFFPLLLLHLNKSHVIYNNNRPTGNVKNEPREQNTREASTVVFLSLLLFLLHEPVENESPTMTQTPSLSVITATHYDAWIPL